jgi:phage terminase large subunit GpA-like protein
MPGYSHFNKSYDDDYFDQLTSEEVVTSYKKGQPVRAWRLKEGKKRNEALDMRVYALSAFEGLRLMGFRLRKEHQRIMSYAGLPEKKSVVPIKEIVTPTATTQPEQPKEAPATVQYRSPLMLTRRKKKVIKLVHR